MVRAEGRAKTGRRGRLGIRRGLSAFPDGRSEVPDAEGEGETSTAAAPFSTASSTTLTALWMGPIESPTFAPPPTMRQPRINFFTSELQRAMSTPTPT